MSKSKASCRARTQESDTLLTPEFLLRFTEAQICQIYNRFRSKRDLYEYLSQRGKYALAAPASVTIRTVRARRTQSAGPGLRARKSRAVSQELSVHRANLCVC